MMGSPEDEKDRIGAQVLSHSRLIVDESAVNVSTSVELKGSKKMTRHARDPAASVCAVLAGMLALSLALGGAKPVAAAATLEELAAPLNIDPTFITVSGISSGGFMAHQFHVAHSGHVAGAGIVAGGPYACSQGDAITAITACSKTIALACKGIVKPFTPFDPSVCDRGYTGPVSEASSVDLAAQAFSAARDAAAQGRIDDLKGLAAARVYLFTAASDEIVPYGVMNAVRHFYTDSDKAQVQTLTFNRLFESHHTMVTDNFYRVDASLVGQCQRASFGDPYVADCRAVAQDMSACFCPTGTGACSVANPIASLCNGTSDPQNFNPQTAWPDAPSCVQNVQVEACQSAASVDLAGAILLTLYPGIPAGSRSSLLDVHPASAGDAATSKRLSSKMSQFSQQALVQSAFGRADQQAWGSLAEYGYVYIPPYCAQGGTCGLHVAFHGCKQGGETDPPFGNIYAKYAGYNEWAKLNAIVVLYPQIQDTTFGPVNPEGCWDWWGYTDANYANQSGRQIRAVAQMINILAHRTDQPLLPVPAGN